MPQRSGSIVHWEYYDGYVVTLGGWIMFDADNPACGSDLRRGWDQLGLHLNFLTGEVLDLDGDNARLEWLPTDYGQARLLGNLRVAQELTSSNPGGGPVEFSFALHSPYPYSVDGLQTSTDLPDGSDVAIVNPGNCPVFVEVFRVYGPTSSFLVTHVESGKTISYDDSLPGASAIAGGDWATINMFANTVYRNDNLGNLKPGIDLTTSDFFPLLPGTNTLSCSGADATFGWNAGWA